MGPLRRGAGAGWLLAGHALLGAVLALSPRLGGAAAEPVGTPLMVFWLVVVGAGLCAVAAGALVWVAWRRGLPEHGLLGALLWGVSVLPLVHGLTVPGVVVGPNGATSVSVLVALPTAALAALPLLARDTPWARTIAARWRRWVLLTTSVTSLLAVALLAFPQAWRPVDPTSPGTLLLAVAGFTPMALLARRHLRLYLLGRSPASLVTAVGFTNLALSALVWLAPVEMSVGWWGVHLLDISGVFLACFALLRLRPAEDVTDFLRPVLARDPLVVLELGLSPVVRGFVARVGAKDLPTRAHMVRAAELAMRLGVRAGLAPHRLRALGLAALLHDVGKVGVPDAVLTKPGALTDEEYAVIKGHSHLGHRMLLGEPTLADAAPLVRGHHERPDGTGYPDGLAGEEVSLEQGIISAVDAFDAITNTRHYREGMPVETAVAILCRGSGTQFVPRAVGLLVDHLEAHDGADLRGVFADVDAAIAELEDLDGLTGAHTHC